MNVYYLNETCPHAACGKPFDVTADDAPGLRENESYDCPWCGKHAGTIRCSGIPSTSRRSRGLF